jgi:hypothetical protein
MGEDELRSLLLELRQLREEFHAIKNGTVKLPPPTPRKPTWDDVLQKFHELDERLKRLELDKGRPA